LFKSLLKTALKLLFPRICCFCSSELPQSDIDLCMDCKVSLPFVEDRCYRCGLRLEKENEAIICESCQNKAPAFSRLCSLFSYDPPVNRLVTGLKFNKQLAYGRILSELLLEAVETNWYKNATLPQAIIPVPLHKKRLRARGYNQVMELLRSFRKQNKIPVLHQQCWRSRQTKKQSGLNAEARRHNLKDAFQVQLPYALSHVAIVDDVVTTGSTVAALSLALKNAGVDNIDVWCVCRA
jgi:ComF family protein